MYSVDVRAQCRGGNVSDPSFRKLRLGRKRQRKKTNLKRLDFHLAQSRVGSLGDETKNEAHK